MSPGSSAGGSFVAGRSHGLGCTAASGIGADQCCSLTDSPGARAAKSVPMARFCGAVIRQLLHSLGEWNFTAGDSAPNRKNEFDEYLSCDRSGRNGHGNE